MMTASFNLIDEQWIPCIDLEGNSVELGIRDTLTHAHELREVYDESPLVTISIYRLLLAILHRVFGPESPRDWFDLRARGWWLAGPVDEYLDRWHDHFDIFSKDEAKRFYQSMPIDPAESLEEEGPPKILHMVYSRLNNPALFSHQLDSSFPGVTYAEAAKQLLAAQVFRPGGKATGCANSLKAAPCNNSALFMITGQTSFEMLLLNMSLYPNARIPSDPANDRPTWEWDDPFSVDRMTILKGEDTYTIPYGYLDYLSWQHFRIWLYPEENGVVKHFQIGSGLYPVHETIFDPMVAYIPQKTAKEDASPYRKLNFSEDRALWRDSAALLRKKREPGSAGYPPQFVNNIAELREVDESYLDPSLTYHVQALGMLSSRGKVVLQRHERFPLRLEILWDEALLEDLNWCLQKAEEVSQKTRGAAMDLAELVLSKTADQKGGRKADKSGKADLVDKHWGVMRDYWGALEPAFWELVAALPDDPDHALTIWEGTLKRTAWDTFRRAERLAGDDTKALKAAAVASRQLGGGLKKLFEKAEA